MLILTSKQKKDVGYVEKTIEEGLGIIKMLHSLNDINQLKPLKQKARRFMNRINRITKRRVLNYVYATQYDEKFADIKRWKLLTAIRQIRKYHTQINETPELAEKLELSLIDNARVEIIIDEEAEKFDYIIGLTGEFENRERSLAVWMKSVEDARIDHYIDLARKKARAKARKEGREFNPDEITEESVEDVRPSGRSASRAWARIYENREAKGSKYSKIINERLQKVSQHGRDVIAPFWGLLEIPSSRRLPYSYPDGESYATPAHDRPINLKETLKKEFAYAAGEDLGIKIQKINLSIEQAVEYKDRLLDYYLKNLKELRDLHTFIKYGDDFEYYIRKIVETLQELEYV